MKLSDMPTPEHDALFRGSNDRSLGDELCMVYVLAHSLERRLAIAVAALRKIEDTDNYASDGGWDAGGMGPDEISRDAIAQIMEKE